MTAEATLRLNASDGGDRRYILVSSTEAKQGDLDRNDCRDKCAARVSAVSKDLADGRLDVGFGYLVCDRMNFEDIPYELTDEQIWCSIAALHRLPLQHYEPDVPVQVLRHSQAVIAYCPKTDEESIEAVRAFSEDMPLLVYSHTGGQLRDAFRDRRNVEVRLVPDELTKRFVS